MISEFQVVDTLAGYDRRDLSQVPTLMCSNSSLATGILVGTGDESSWLDHAEVLNERV